MCDVGGKNRMQSLEEREKNHIYHTNGCHHRR